MAAVVSTRMIRLAAVAPRVSTSPLAETIKVMPLTGAAVVGGQTAYNTGVGFFLGYSGGAFKFSIGDPAANHMLWDGSQLVIDGNVTATTGAIGGFNIGADYIRDAANSFGMASTVTGGDDVRFWAGAAFASRDTAPFRLTEAGIANMTGALFNSAASGKRIDINVTNANEMAFYGDSGAGVELLSTIGIKAVGGDYVIGSFGTATAGNTKVALSALSDTSRAINAASNSGNAIEAATGGASAYGLIGLNNAATGIATVYGGVLGQSADGVGVRGYASGAGRGVYATSNSGTALYAFSLSGLGAYFSGNATKAAVLLNPQAGVPSDTTEGQISYDSTPHTLKFRDNSAWRTVLTDASLTSALTTVGALNAGSITSGFGSIDVGADAITGGAGSFTTLTASSTVTAPGQPAFLAYLNTGVTNVTGNDTIATLVCDTEVFDQAGNHSTGTGKFTAPVAGRYRHSGGVYLTSIGGVDYVQLLLVTSNRTYVLDMKQSPAGSEIVLNGSVLADMDASDEAYLRVQAGTLGSDTVDLSGAGAYVNCYFSGELVA